MVYIIIILSFFLEAAFSCVITTKSLLVPLFLLTSLVILYPYFKNNKFNYFITSVICGFIYDISFSNSLFINTISFGISSGLVILMYNYINYNIFSSNLVNIAVIIFYRIISYLFICIIDFVSFDESILFSGIYSSIIFNIIYGVIIYLLCIPISSIFNIKKD